mmetsp:Transcript_5208/g.8816  ORF Transcript_5208/g.8816 Transcript_5208/m.8816 type:complete len:202 (+) Transcript_5208:83-688(+)
MKSSSMEKISIRTPSLVNPVMSTSATGDDSVVAAPSPASKPSARWPSRQVSLSKALKNGILARTHLCAIRTVVGGLGGSAERAEIPAPLASISVASIAVEVASFRAPGGCGSRLTKQTSAWRPSLTAAGMSESDSHQHQKRREWLRALTLAHVEIEAGRRHHHWFLQDHTKAGGVLKLDGSSAQRFKSFHVRFGSEAHKFS